MAKIHKVIDTDYRYLLESYELKDIERRLKYWLVRIDRAIETLGLKDQVVVNELLLDYFICDYFADIVRLKEFHPVENANLKKILSYGSYWFLRRHPLQIISSDVDEKSIYINEKVVLTVIIGEIIENGKIADLNNKFIDLLFYYLKYRVYTAQSLEIIIEALMRGNDLTPIIDSQTKDLGI